MRQELMREKEAALAQYRGNGDPQAFFRRYGAALEALLAKLWQQYFSGCPYCLLAVGGFAAAKSIRIPIWIWRWWRPQNCRQKTKTGLPASCRLCGIWVWRRL